MNSRMLDAKQLMKRSRWDTDEDKPMRRNNAMEYLGPFGNDTDASMVSRLSEMYYADRVREQELRPAKSGMEKDVAMSMSEKASQKRMQQNTPIQVHQAQPVLFNRGSPEDFNLRNNMGMPGGPSGPQIPNFDRSNVGPNIAFQQMSQSHPFFQANQIQNGQPKPFSALQGQQPLFQRGPAENINLKNNMGMPGGPFGLQIPNLNRSNVAPMLPFPQWPSPHLFFPQQMQNGQPNPMLMFQARPPFFNTGSPDNINLKNNMGMPGGPFGLQFPSFEGSNMAPNLAFPQWPLAHPFFQAHQKQYSQEMPTANMAEHAPKEQTGSSLLSDLSAEDITFFKKLMTLLSALPENSTPADNSQMRMLKPQTENISASQQLATTSMGSTDALIQQFMMMASQNPTQLTQNLMQMASEVNESPMEQAQENKNQLLMMLSLLQSRQNPGIPQMNMTSSPSPSGQNPPNQGYGQRDGNSMVPSNQNAYQDQPVDTHKDSLRVDSKSHMKSTSNSYEDRSYPSGIYSEERDQSPYGNVSTDVADDHSPADRTPYTRIRLSPSATKSGKERVRDSDADTGKEKRSRERTFDREKQSSRRFEDPKQSQRKKDVRYRKRSRPNRDNVPQRSTDRGEKQPDDFLDSLPVDVLKRIRGRDPFTVSAILSEYAESRRSK